MDQPDECRRPASSIHLGPGLLSLLCSYPLVRNHGVRQHTNAPEVLRKDLRALIANFRECRDVLLDLLSPGGDRYGD